MTGYNAVLARNTQNAPRASGPYSQTVAFSHYNNLSAQLPIDPKTGALAPGGIRAQALQCFKNIEAIVDGIDHVMDDVVRISIFVTHSADIALVQEVYGTFFPRYVPALTCMVVAALPRGALVQVEALLANGEGTIPGEPQAGDLVKMTRNTENAPFDALSAQSVAFSHYNYLSAQLPIDPRTGELVAGGIAAQARQCLNNIKAIVQSIDVPLDDIVKLTIFVKDIADTCAVNAVYKTFFPDSAIARTVGYLPARTVVQVEGLPLDALVQMEAVVSHGAGTPPQAVEDRHGIVINACNTCAAPISPYSSQSVAFSHYNHISAQLPLYSTTGELVPGGIEEQAEQCLNNINVILQRVGHVMEDVVKVNIFLRHIEDSAAVDRVYTHFFPDAVPARRTVAVSALPKNALIQIEAVVANAEGTPPASRPVRPLD